ncbi:hypothetical protein [Sorangium sp. So ce128]|uniref:hypothetical protein n=1 Tax=Sorangium sp. So ce128 TaxID=3133281 RepID=UPI003F5F9F07
MRRYPERDQTAIWNGGVRGMEQGAIRRLGRFFEPLAGRPSLQMDGKLPTHWQGATRAHRVCYAAAGPGDVERLSGREARTFDPWLERHPKVFA